MTASTTAPSTLVTTDKVITSFDPPRTMAGAAIGVRDGLIDWVGPKDAAPADRYEQIVRLPGTALPGLVDAHVHLSFDPDVADPISDALDSVRARVTQTIESNGRRFLERGVTTVRDLGSMRGVVLEAGRGLGRGTWLGPRIVAADQPITRPQGHAWRIGIQSDSATSARAAVRDLFDRGAGAVKIMVTGGRMTVGTDPLSVEFPSHLIAAVVDAAHEVGLNVAAHCLSVAGIRAALSAQVDSIEHGTFISPNGLGCDEETVERLAQEIAQSGTYLCPTINADYPGRHPIPFEQRLHWVSILHRVGVKVIVGNDTGIPGLPPDLYPGALRALESAGMSSAQVLHSATALACQALGLGRNSGTLAPGLAADLIVVEGDPLADLRALSAPALVMVGGRTVAGSRT
ncbi:amidohydrolase family protein [Streptomyces sp. SID8361]|uniref:metal-dependent hydrolase family protein n=1 Tax=Streptomyces sp. MnatMP-M27 TaxID=1839768 RepID=UPI00081F54C9|nr:amidohydrolase family protein [Streptomyces sp. MnatMP-M27]MYU12129.1 amidohydrolase family protein [Streptomyces sp. SID8361]SCF88420.1 Imidazolonepropionase [Streptomyces sp. MnatMP-M27]